MHSVTPLKALPFGQVADCCAALAQCQQTSSFGFPEIAPQWTPPAFPWMSQLRMLALVSQPVTSSVLNFHAAASKWIH
jgi:hypothetical protein